jgi:hypothetical protein
MCRRRRQLLQVKEHPRPCLACRIANGDPQGKEYVAVPSERFCIDAMGCFHDVFVGSKTKDIDAASVYPSTLVGK